MDIFLFIVGVMCVLGVIDLLVGVANDAVNFTNSAVGSKASTRRVIILISAVGIVFGAMSSNGMMEVARKGIFHPNAFTLQELMFLFLAVMVADVILLDLYNTLGLPTSTTVSLVFELLGASLAMALLKTDTVNQAFEIINSASALKIIFSIVLSVILAFFSGLILMFFFRLIFSFRTENSMKVFGGIFAGLATSIVIFFVLLTAMKGSTILQKEWVTWINDNLWRIMLFSFLGFSVFYQGLIFAGVNVLKIVVLLGTASLAMAFASNDLVNFIGVPIASLQTYELIKISNWDVNTLATGLAETVPTPNLILFSAALVMIFALFKSKKAETVTQTEVTLGSQGETLETFQTSLVARVFVQIALGIYYPVRAVLPKSIRNWVGSRFKQNLSTEIVRLHETEAFDMLRASVNILIASALILVGTIHKLPLSTTFVTFMVAMGTSLADGAWQRDNAVNRVSGVLTVVGSWFMTAIMASLMGGMIAAIFHFWGIIAVAVILAITFGLVILFNRVHAKRKEEYEESMESLVALRRHPEKALSRTISSMLGSLVVAKKAMNTVCSGYVNGKKKDFKQTAKHLKNLKKMYENSLSNFLSLAERHLDENEFHTIHPVTNALGQIDHITESLWNILRSTSSKIDRFQSGLSKEEREDLKELRKQAEEIFELLADADRIPGLLEKATSKKKTKDFEKIKEQIYKNQMKRIRKGDSRLKSSVSYFVVIEELVDINDSLIKLAEELSLALPWAEQKKKEFLKAHLSNGKMAFPAVLDDKKDKDKKKKKKDKV
ncbi:phosphate permease [Leptospira perolatii]|uniref:Phosphate transporter n=1 Tax=Leptospira perolatii TaxID=2023191 RepID=A0A2M9ZQQ9_9LEPT|nr:inorganic phosphate transporter [Leptospira perolatii]PJZ74365.1 phosphate permease [Leptospira perolatii]